MRAGVFAVTLLNAAGNLGRLLVVTGWGWPRFLTSSASPPRGGKQIESRMGSLVIGSEVWTCRRMSV